MPDDELIAIAHSSMESDGPINTSVLEQYCHNVHNTMVAGLQPQSIFFLLRASNIPFRAQHPSIRFILTQI